MGWPMKDIMTVKETILAMREYMDGINDHDPRVLIAVALHHLVRVRKINKGIRKELKK
jgi:hypothetical protein